MEFQPLNPDRQQSHNVYMFEVSQATRGQASRYLGHKGLSLDELNSEQQQVVCRFMKDKRSSRLVTPLCLLASALLIAACAYGFQMREDITERLVPHSIQIEDAQETRSVELVPRDRLRLIRYNSTSLLLGACMGIMAASVVSFLAIPISSNLSNRKLSRALSAFLHAPKIEYEHKHYPPGIQDYRTTQPAQQPQPTETTIP